MRTKMSRLVVTIDGPAGSGKSTVAQLAAMELEAGFLDTGAMYRAVTLAAMRAGADMNDAVQLLAVLEDSSFEFTFDGNAMKVSINGMDATEAIRKPEVTANAKYIASQPAIRNQLVDMQRQFAKKHKRIVTEGRDQGTVAFADADYKIFLTADPKERARRRQAQLAETGTHLPLEKILKDIETRDKSDQLRSVGPLKPADDAVIIDTTGLTIEQVVKKIVQICK
jgi:cytidylate kinase